VSDDAFGLVTEEQTVTGATKYPRPLSETPSSVTVVTAAEIRAMGYRSLGDALRWVRGLFVTYDRNYTYVGVRGLQRPGDLNNKILLALDGHTLDGYVYGDAPFGPELGIDLEDLDRIEVVRGPGSALYGSHAVLAVINLVTQHPHSEPGTVVTGSAGSWNERSVYASVASARPGRAEWWVSTSWLDAPGRDLYFPGLEPGSPPFGVASRLDGERAKGLYAGAEWGDFAVRAKWNEREKDLPTGVFGTVFGDPRTRTRDGYSLIELSGHRRLAATMELNGRVYWDGTRYAGTWVYDGDSTRVVNQDHGDGDLLGTELRSHWAPWSGHVLTLGVEGRSFLRAQQHNYDESPYQMYVDVNARGESGALYGQDEFRLAGGVRLTGGARLDAARGSTPVVSPRLDALWHAPWGASWKLLAGTAFRAPSPYERYYDDGYTQVRNPDLEPERVTSVEASVDQRLGPALLTVAAYDNRVRDLIDLIAIDSLGLLTFENRARVRCQGVEGEAQFTGPAGTRARMDVACQRSKDDDTGVELTNSARWNAHLLLVRAPADSRFSTGFGLRYLSSRLTRNGERSVAVTTVDARVGVGLGAGMRLELAGHNLLDARFGDPASDEFRQDQIPQDGRSWTATLGVRLGPR
jgi:iron complex outermembrane receptor protein